MCLQQQQQKKNQYTIDWHVSVNFDTLRICENKISRIKKKEEKQLVP